MQHDVALGAHGLRESRPFLAEDEDAGPCLSEAMRAECDVVLHIEQFGSTRSINAGAAAAIAMHAWVRRHVFDQHP